MTIESVRHKSSDVVLFVDVINHFEFPDGDQLLQEALPIARNLLSFKKRARRAKVPVLYVNDNFGQWRSDASKLLKYCLRSEAVGRDFVAAVAPDEEDYFVLKPMHSAFYQTPLDVLLRYFEARTVILCGVATNSCIVCTAHDARMRDLNIVVAADCCAAKTAEVHERALDHIAATTGARVLKSSSVRFSKR